MIKILNWVSICAGLFMIVYSDDIWWVAILGFIIFSVGLIGFVNEEIRDAKEKIKEEILDEIEERLNEE